MLRRALVGLWRDELLADLSLLDGNNMVFVVEVFFKKRTTSSGWEEGSAAFLEVVVAGCQYIRRPWVPFANRWSTRWAPHERAKGDAEQM